MFLKKHWIPKRTLFIPPKNVLHKMKKWMKHVLQKALDQTRTFHSSEKRAPQPQRNMFFKTALHVTSKRALFMFA